MTFSIIVPVYNSIAYLGTCIDSIINQTFKNFELIIVDDGSTDGSAQLCDLYSNQDSRVIVIHKKNGGSTSARKTGCQYAKNDYIVCVDSDDYIDNDFLETINKNLSDSTDVLCIGFRNEKGKCLNKHQLGVYGSQQLLDSFMYDERLGFPNEGNVFFGLWSKIVRRDLFVNCQKKVPDKIVMGEDLLLMSYVFKESSEISIISYCGYFYRTNNTSVSRTFNIKRPTQYVDVCQELIKVYENEKNRVYCFALFNLLNLESEAARNSSSYKEFKRIVSISQGFVELNGIVKKASIKKTNLKNRIKILLNRYRMFFLMYVLYNI